MAKLNGRRQIGREAEPEQNMDDYAKVCEAWNTGVNELDAANKQFEPHCIHMNQSGENMKEKCKGMSTVTKYTKTCSNCDLVTCVNCQKSYVKKSCYACRLDNCDDGY